MALTVTPDTPVTGPFYVYDRSLKNRDKLPPHFHNRFFHFSFQAIRMYVNTLDTVSGAITRTDRLENGLFQKVPLRSPLAARIGADGALYVLNYDGYYTVLQPAVERIGYTGACVLDPLPTAARPGTPDPGVRMTPLGLVVEGRHELILHDTEGRQLLRLEGRSGATYSLSDLRARIRSRGGLAILGVRTEQGSFTRKIAP